MSVTDDELEETVGFSDTQSATCPYCGEEVELTVDPVGASSEQYVEDCPVCCRPWNVFVVREEDRLELHLQRDDE